MRIDTRIAGALAAALFALVLLGCTAKAPEEGPGGASSEPAPSESMGTSEDSPARPSEAGGERPAEIQFPTEVEGEIEVRSYRLLRADGFSAYVPAGWTAKPMPDETTGEGTWLVNGGERPIQAILVEWLPRGTTSDEARAAFEAASNLGGGRVYASEAAPAAAPWALRFAAVADRNPALPAWEYASVYLVAHGDRFLLVRTGSIGDGLDGLAAVRSVFFHSWRWDDDGTALVPGDHPGLLRLVGLGWSFEYPEAWSAAGAEPSPSGGTAAHVLDPKTGDGLVFASRPATPAEVDRYVRAEIARKLGASECDVHLEAPLASERAGGATAYRYAIRSHCGDMPDAVLYDAVFFDGRMMVELRSVGRVPQATFEAIASSFGFGP